jgi:small-conductance mechanosensitive channel
MAPNDMTRAGFFLFISIYAWALLLFVRLLLAREGLPPSERRAMHCFAATIAPMVVRIAYSLVYTVTGNEKFSAVLGSAVIYVFMTMIPEVVVMVLVAWATLSMSRPATADGDVEGQKGETHEFGPVRSKDSREENGAVLEGTR